MSYTIGNDLVPAMTAATISGVTVSDGGNIGGGYEGWRAFDDSAGDTMWNDGATAPNYIKVDFGTAKIVASYRIRARASYLSDSPKTWVLEGSNDDSIWDVLDAQSNAPAWSGYEWRKYDLTENSISIYRYYRITPTENYSSSNYAIGEMELLEGISEAPTVTRRFAQII